MTALTSPRPSFTVRWVRYLNERFPPLPTGLLVLALTGSTLHFAGSLSASGGWPGNGPLVVAFTVVLLAFLQLRIADEFKDRDVDARHRAHRPVPRGLVTLPELARLGVLAASAQAVLCLLYDPRLLLPLLLVWGYGGLMTVEFFAPSWLRARPWPYLLSHLGIVPLLVLFTIFAMATDLGRDAVPPLCLWALFCYLQFAVVEVGRKLRSPGDERRGVESYTAAWGTRRAVAAWLALKVTAGLAGLAAAAATDGAPPLAIAVLLLLVLDAAVVSRFLGRARTGSGNRLRDLSALWVLVTLPLAGSGGGWLR